MSKKVIPFILKSILFLSFAGLIHGFFTAKLLTSCTQSRTTTVKTQMKDIGTALRLYKMKKGFYPVRLKDLTKKNSYGDNYLKFISKDTWGNNYIYFKIDKKFEIISYGADGKRGGEGDDGDIYFTKMNRRE